MLLTMAASVGAANCRSGCTTRDNELVVLADVIGAVGLGQDKVFKVQSELTDIGVVLVDGQLTRAHRVEGRRVAGALKVGAVLADGVAAGGGD